MGDGIKAIHGSWSFSGDVADSFVSHITKSVPNYDLGHKLICQISEFFINNSSICYEIGVSTAELIAKLAEYNSSKPNARWVGLDIEQKMIDAGREHCSKFQNIELIHTDCSNFEYEPADLIIAYYCIQFIPQQKRNNLIQKIYDSLNKGGAFIFFEKVRAPNARFQDISNSLYEDYKTEQGYTEQEIISKSRSLRGVLEPYTSEQNMEMLSKAGFSEVWPVMKHICFEGLLAIK